MLVEPFKDIHGHVWHAELGHHRIPSKLKLDGLSAVVLEGKANVGPDRHELDVQYGPIYRQARKLGIPVYLVEQRRFLAELQGAIGRSAFLSLIIGPILQHSTTAPAAVNALLLPERERMHKDEILTPWRVSLGRVAMDPMVGLRSAIHADKAHDIANLHGRGSKLGFVTGKIHWLSLESLHDPRHAEEMMRRYGAVLRLETEEGRVHRYEFKGGTWVRTDLRL